MSDYPTEIEANGKVVKLRVPTSLGIRYSITGAYDTNPSMAKATALGVCNPELQRRLRYDHKPLTYGQRVVDFLADSGWSIHEIERAGDLSLALIFRSLNQHNWEAVESAEDFSELGAQEPESTP